MAMPYVVCQSTRGKGRGKERGGEKERRREGVARNYYLLGVVIQPYAAICGGIGIVVPPQIAT